MASRSGSALPPRPQGATRVVLIRHGEPAATARGRIYGRLDVPLSAAGAAQARRLALTLAGDTFETVYSSPRRRAVETAVLLGAPVVVDALRELDFGALEGRTYDEVAATDPELYAAWMATPTAVRFPGGECYADLAARVLATLGELRGRHRGESFAVVTHGGVVRCALAHALAMPDEAIFRIACDHASVSVLDWFDDTPVVTLVNGRLGPDGGGRTR